MGRQGRQHVRSVRTRTRLLYAGDQRYQAAYHDPPSCSRLTYADRQGDNELRGSEGEGGTPTPCGRL